MQLTLEIPDQYLNQQSPAQMVTQIKLYAALLMFQSGQLSRGTAWSLRLWIFISFCRLANSIISA